jgi:hypothetical protein
MVAGLRSPPVAAKHVMAWLSDKPTIYDRLNFVARRRRIERGPQRQRAATMPAYVLAKGLLKSKVNKRLHSNVDKWQHCRDRGTIGTSEYSITCHTGKRRRVEPIRHDMCQKERNH